MTDIAQSPPPPTIPTPAELFLHFMWAAVRGFGGVFVMGRRMLVEETQWLTPDEFVEVLGLCQFLPGANIVNVSVAVGARFRGWTGSLCALTGILLAPCLIAVGLTALYERYSVLPVVGHAMGAVAAAASGLVLGSALKMAGPVLAKDPVLATPILAGVVLTVGVSHWPLPLALLVGVPISLWIAYARRGRAA